MLNTLYPIKEISAYHKMVRFLMQKGKRSKAETIIFKTLNNIINSLHLEETKKKWKEFRTEAMIFGNTKKILQVPFFGIKSQKKKRTSFREKNTFYQIKKNDTHFTEPVNNGKQILKILDILDQSVSNVSPYLEIKKVRVSRKTRQLPLMINKKRQQTLAMRYLIEAANKRKKRTTAIYESFAQEILDAFEKQGAARQKRRELHKIAHANRTFLRYRWW